MPRTSFQPTIHGFHFSNADVPYSWGMGGGTGGGLCGGMSFSSLDFFYHRLPIPSISLPPEEGSPLQNYLLRRQLNAHEYAIPRLISGDPQWRQNPFEASVRIDQNFGTIKRMIDHGRPVPILLSASGAELSTNSHWVVAIGYEQLPTSTYGCAVMSKIYLYDNNYPNTEKELIIDWTRSVLKINGTRRIYSSYAPFDGYTSIRPTREEMSVSPNATNLATNPFNIRY